MFPESTSVASAPANTTKYIKNADGHFVCPYCAVVKEKQNTMHYHIKTAHTKDLPFECKKCDSHPRFCQRNAYLRHLASVHPDDPHDEPNATPTSDSDCGDKSAAAVANPYAGVYYTCPAPSCEHKSHTKGNVRIHFIRTHCKDWIPAFEKGTPCTGCGKECASSSAYLYHAPTCFKSRATDDQLNMLSRIK
jgi:hypothetical protein